MAEVREERCEAGCIAYHGGERRHHPDCVVYPESFTKLHDDLVQEHAELKAQNDRLQAALDAALAGQLDRGEGLLDPGMPAEEIRLHMGEMSAQEVRTARAAIRWANAVAEQTAPAATGTATHRHKKGGLYRLIARGRIEATLEPCAIYEGVGTGLVWVRPEAEFEDGRFTSLVPEERLPELAPLPQRDGGT